MATMTLTNQNFDTGIRPIPSPTGLCWVNITNVAAAGGQAPNINAILTVLDAGVWKPWFTFSSDGNSAVSVTWQGQTSYRVQGAVTGTMTVEIWVS